MSLDNDMRDDHPRPLDGETSPGASKASCACPGNRCIGRHYGGQRCDVHIDGELLRFWVGDQLVKTAARTSTGQVRNKQALRTATGPD